MGPQSTTHWVVIGMLTTWFILTFFTQVKGPVRRAIKSRDYLGLLPIWSFFGPQPLNSDLLMQFRDFRGDGTMTDWQTVDSNPPRRWYHLFWNPRRRGHGALMNSVRALPPIPTPDDRLRFKKSAGYRAILAMIAHLPGTPGACERQFSLVAVRRIMGQVVQIPVFLSDRTPLPAASNACARAPFSVSPGSHPA